METHMRKLLLAIVLCLFASPALAQNPTCPTRPFGDSSNACASTAFVQSAASGGSGATARQRLTATTSYWVRTDGNDANCTGLTNAAYVSGSFPQNCAFLTIQHAADTVSNTLDLNGQFVNIALGNGTY